MNRTATIATVAGLAVGTGVLLGLIVHQLRKSVIRLAMDDDGPVPVDDTPHLSQIQHDLDQVAPLPDTEAVREMDKAFDSYHGRLVKAGASAAPGGHRPAPGHQEA